MSLRELLGSTPYQVLHGKPDPLVTDVVTKPYQLRAGTLLFRTRRREELDWEQYQKYKNAVIVLRKREGTPEDWGRLTVVQVPDVREAYWKFVDSYRKRFSIPVYAITGTCGKSTTKEMIAHLWRSAGYNVQATVRSRNASRFNLPYLLGIELSTDVAVFETGVARYPDDLHDSGKYFQPTIGIMTNIGLDHLSGCGTFENYLKGKAEMLDIIEPTGTFLYNADDENIAKIERSVFPGRQYSFGKSSGADFRATDIRYGEGGMEFTLQFRGISHALFVPGYGEPNVYNALAAIAGVHAAGMGIREAGEHLRTFQHLPGHMQLKKGVNGSLILDDSWSSNPVSFRSALQVMPEIAKGRRMIVVTGRLTDDIMEELDTESRKIGRLVVEQGVEVLITRGPDVRGIGKGALAAGMNPRHVQHAEDLDEAYRILLPYLDGRALVLVKSSYYDLSDDLLDRIVLS